MKCGLMLMLLLQIGCLTTFQSKAQLKEKVLSDTGILYVVDLYLRYIESDGFESHRKYHTAICVDKISNPKLVFITGVGSISFLQHGQPELYSVYKGRYVFVYFLQKVASTDSSRFVKMYNQFKGSIELDVGPDGSVTPVPNSWIDDIQGWRVELSSRNIVKRTVSTFPTFDISGSFKYDEEGNVLYKDGIPDGNFMGRNGARWDNPRKFILGNTDVPMDSLSSRNRTPGRRRNVWATLVVDERGEVIESKVIGIIHEPTRRKVEKILLKMPILTPARKGNKPIKVRFRVSI